MLSSALVYIVFFLENLVVYLSPGKSLHEPLPPSTVRVGMR